MITRQNTIKAECEKAVLLKKKAEEYKPPPPEVKKEKGLDLFGTDGSASKSGKKTRINMCACGVSDPEFKGYCGDCVKKLKDKFNRHIAKYNKLKKEYEDYNQADTAKADEKMKLLKNKMAQYGAMDEGMMDVISKHENLMNSDENRAFAEFKVSVQSMKQEIKIIKAR